METQHGLGCRSWPGVDGVAIPLTKSLTAAPESPTLPRHAASDRFAAIYDLTAVGNIVNTRDRKVLDGHVSIFAKDCVARLSSMLTAFIGRCVSRLLCLFSHQTTPASKL